MAAVPGKMGIGTFSPLLDSAGNSVCGIKMLEHLSRELSLYVY
jgi:glutaminase